MCDQKRRLNCRVATLTNKNVWLKDPEGPRRPTAKSTLFATSESGVEDAMLLFGHAIDRGGALIICKRKESTAAEMEYVATQSSSKQHPCSNATRQMLYVLGAKKKKTTKKRSEAAR